LWHDRKFNHMGYYLTSTEELQGLIRKTVEDLLNERLPKQSEQKPKHPLDDYMNAQEAAEFLRLSIATIYTMTSRRQIPFYKKGKKLYFRQEDLFKWMETGKHKDVNEIREQAIAYVQSGQRKV
jgi:excisionase family DNA binding protein